MKNEISERESLEPGNRTGFSKEIIHSVWFLAITIFIMILVSR